MINRIFCAASDFEMPFCVWDVQCLSAGGEDKVVELFEREGKTGPRTPLLENKADPGKPRRADVEHPLPLSWCVEPWELGQDFYIAAKFGIVQYVSFSNLMFRFLFSVLNIWSTSVFSKSNVMFIV